MDIQILELIEGAKQAKGLTVIIDVFRAFSLECCLFDMGVREIRPAGSIEETFAWREKDPEVVLIGERRGRMIDGFDFGNSPSTVLPEAVRGKKIIHTTSAGTQGIVNAVHADEIITGSLMNARAVAAYIRKKNPQTVSLVCMGNGGIRTAKEDVLCAQYIKSILEGREMEDIRERALMLREDGGEHFFDPENQSVFPQADFYRCIEVDRFDFVIRIEKDSQGYISVPIR